MCSLQTHENSNSDSRLGEPGKARKWGYVKKTSGGEKEGPRHKNQNTTIKLGHNHKGTQEKSFLVPEGGPPLSATRKPPPMGTSRRVRKTIYPQKTNLLRTEKKARDTCEVSPLKQTDENENIGGGQPEQGGFSFFGLRVCLGGRPYPFYKGGVP